MKIIEGGLYCDAMWLVIGRLVIWVDGTDFSRTLRIHCGCTRSSIRSIVRVGLEKNFYNLKEKRKKKGATEMKNSKIKSKTNGINSGFQIRSTSRERQFI